MISNWLPKLKAKDSSNNDTLVSAQPETADHQEPPHKRPSLALDFFGDLFTSNQTVSDDDELDLYLKSGS